MYFKETLKEALRTGQIVRVHHAIDAGYVDGFVAAVGLDCFVLEVFNEAALNGFTCLKISDIAECDAPAPYHEFLRSVVRLRGLKRGKPPKLDLGSMLGAIKSARVHGLFVSIHLQEEFDEGFAQVGISFDCCYIGKILSVSNDTIEMHCILPDAKWDEEPEQFETQLIYRMDFGGGYENSLLLVSEATEGSQTRH